MNLQSSIIQHFGGIDKVMHALKGFGIFGIAIAIFMHDGTYQMLPLLLYGNLTALVVGLFKEYMFDYLFGGEVEFADVVATMKGSFIGTLIFILGIMLASLL